MLLNFYFPKIKSDNIHGIEEVILYEKYFFRIFPLTSKESLLPYKSCNKKVDGPICSTI